MVERGPVLDGVLGIARALTETESDSFACMDNGVDLWCKLMASAPGVADVERRPTKRTHLESEMHDGLVG